MNKLTKAGIATGAAVVLLMGGAGTLAYWNSEADLTTGTINAGTLTVTPSATPGTWTNQDGAISLAGYRIVPGDELTYTKTVTVFVEGDTLEAELELADGAIAAASTDAEDVALAALLEASAEFDITATGATVSAGKVTFDGDHNPGVTYTVTVEATITFPDGTAAVDNPAKRGQVSLADFDVVLTQVIS